MLFIIICQDKADSSQLRADTRPAHLDYLGGFKDKVHSVGPMLNDGGQPNGSVLIMDFADRAAAENFAANDPYAKAGLFASVKVSRWKQVLPEAKE